MKHLYLILATVCIILSNTAVSQDNLPKEYLWNQKFAKHEFLLYATGGASNLLYRLDKNGTQDGGGFGAFGAGFGAAYVHSLNSSWRISAGVEYSTFGGKALYQSLSEIYDTFDDNGDPVRFSYTLNSYADKQHVALLSVPVKAIYGAPFNEKINFFVAGGLKFALPAVSRSSLKPGTLNSSGYYDYENVSYPDLPEHCYYSNYTVPPVDSKIELHFAAILSVEAGLGFVLSKKLNLYTGLYLDYGLNDMKKSSDKYPVYYHGRISYHSTLNTALVEKVNLMSVGVKIGVGVKRK